MKKTLFMVLSVVTIIATIPVASSTLLFKKKIYVGKPMVTQSELSEEEVNLVLRKRESEKEQRVLDERLSKPPEGARIYESPEGLLYATSKVEYNLRSLDQGSGLLTIYYQVDNAKKERYNYPFRLLKEGQHTIYYYGVDKTGNRETENKYTVIVDDTGPEVNIEFSGNVHYAKDVTYVSPGARVNLFASDASSGVKDIYIRKNGSSFAGIDEANLTLQETGQYNIEALAEDNLLNRSKLASSQVIVENNKPRVEVFISKHTVKVEGVTYCLPGTQMQFRAVDDGSGVSRIFYETRDTDKEVTYAGQWIKLPKQTHIEYQVRAKDRLGNISNPVIFRCRRSFGLPDTIIRAIAEEATKVEHNGEVIK